MVNPEVIQLRLPLPVEKIASLDQLPEIVLIVEKNHPGVVFYLNGAEAMGLCSQELKKVLEAGGDKREVRIIHYHQLLFRGRQPFGGYSDSPLVVAPTKSCITVVEQFNEFDDARMKQVLERIEHGSSFISWVLLVPRWRSMKLLSVLEDWLVAHEIPIFYLESKR